MPSKKLTARNVYTLKAPTNGAVIWWDEEPSAPQGFGVRVTAAEARSYLVAFRVAGKERRVALGRVEETALKAARDEAREYRDAARKGRDLQAERAAKRLRGNTLATLIESYLADRRVQALRTYGEYERLLTKEVGLSVLGPMRPDDVKKADVRALLDAIAGPKRGKRGKKNRERTLKPSPTTAHRVLGVLQACYAWAIDNDRVERAPAWPKPPELPDEAKGGRDRHLAPDELRQVWAAADAEEARGNVIGSALKMLIVTGQRRGETLAMRFDEISEGSWWTIPAERTKNARAHRVPLTSMALEVVEHRRGRGEETWLFPSDRATKKSEGSLRSPSHALARLRAACPSLRHFTIHDFRRTVSTGMAEAGVPQQDIDAVLNHTAPNSGSPRIGKVYNRYARDREKRVALETWERRLRATLSGDTAAATADVVPISARG